MDGVQHGFKIISESSKIPVASAPNHKSALVNSEATTILVSNEISEGRYHVCAGWKPNIVSPLGLVPKSNGGFRLIHDCSMPHGKCVNDYTVTMDKQKYESVEVATSFMTKGCYMAKLDIKSAYRAVAIHPSSYDATGLRWNLNGVDTYLIDLRLPFGARPSPACFHRISQFIKRCMIRRGYQKLVAYQDDFLVLGDTHSECLAAWKELIYIVERLGFELNQDKLIPPSKQMSFLGIILDSEAMSVTLPDEKLVNIREILREYLGKSRATKRQLQSLAGKLNYAASVVRGGRTFLRRLLDCINRLKYGHHKCRLTGDLMLDIRWWHDFMEQFNGKSACIEAHNAVSVMTDACLISGGAFYQGDFYYVNWSSDFQELESLPINYKEAAMASLAIQRWAPLWADKVVYLYSDNQCMVSIINKCSCKNEHVMELLRTQFWMAAYYNVHIKAVYLPGVKNEIADTISRLHEGYGRLLQLEAIINNWFMCHSNIPCAFDTVSFVNHMSLRSLLTLQGLHQWRSVKWPWMYW